MGIDPEQINTQIESVSDNLNSKTLGYGMTFLHELQHTDLGGNLSDTKKEFAKGPTVERVNTIREELDNNPNSTNQKQYGIRKAYMADEVSRTSVNKNYERIIGKIRFTVLNEKGRKKRASTKSKVVKKKQK